MVSIMNEFFSLSRIILNRTVITGKGSNAGIIRPLAKQKTSNVTVSFPKCLSFLMQGAYGPVLNKTCQFWTDQFRIQFWIFVTSYSIFAGYLPSLPTKKFNFSSNLQFKITYGRKRNWNSILFRNSRYSCQHSENWCLQPIEFRSCFLLRGCLSVKLNSLVWIRTKEAAVPFESETVYWIVSKEKYPTFF